MTEILKAHIILIIIILFAFLLMSPQNTKQKDENNENAKILSILNRMVIAHMQMVKAQEQPGEKLKASRGHMKRCEAEGSHRPTDGDQNTRNSERGKHSVTKQKHDQKPFEIALLKSMLCQVKQ